MRKFKRKLAELFFDKTLYTYNEGGFDIKVTKFYISIKAKAGHFSLKLDNSTYTYGYLFVALQNELYNQAIGYAKLIYNTAIISCTDQGLVDDIQRAYVKYAKRMEKQSESSAKAISEDEDSLAMTQMECNERYAKMSKKERKEQKKVLREVLTKDDDE